MFKRKLLVVFVVLSLFAFLGFWLMPEDKYTDRQVKSLPPQENSSPYLDIKQHIREIERPDETFNFPIALGELGPVEPLYAGPPQYPFYCMSLDSKLGQPVPDNDQGWGVPIYDSVENIGKTKHIIGYSKDCSLHTTTKYAARLSDNELVIFDKKPPQEYTHLFRIEQGTINRYIYTLIVPVTAQDLASRTKTSNWNKRLIYQFEGGSGIGFRQGRLRLERLLNRRQEQLEQGYAVITSTGNKTSYTYNMLLAEDTARRVKKQFTSLYGEPLYTVGIGGSGGGLAQYLIGQNSEGILDAALPLYSYPDMVSQTIYALDCDLLNAYYSFKSDDPGFWQDWENRQKLEGMNAKNGDTHLSAWLEPVNQLIAGRWPVRSKGNSECINGWFGLSTFVHNPAQGFLREFFADDIVESTQWNYWEDMVNLYGRDSQNYANSAWGNVGVQYGLNALRSGDISPETFLHLNWNIGSWKPMSEMQPEKIWTLEKNKKAALWLSLWSRHNMTQASETNPAIRQHPNKKAIESAYYSGQVFIGHNNLPTIDIRHYLEDKLDMHHMSASFSARLRLQQALGHYKNQVIWVADENYTPLKEAFEIIDQWMQNIRQTPDLPKWQVKPEQLQDTCFGENGNILFAGPDVWNGEWNRQGKGRCSEHFPIYTNSRIQAGGPWQGSIFECHRVSVEEALNRGFYSPRDMTPHIEALKATFPDGVCDYSQGDKGRPNL